MDYAIVTRPAPTPNPQMSDFRQLDQTKADLAREIREVFQYAYLIEAEIIGAETFPPLNRTMDDIQKARSTFFGLFDDNTLVAIAETRTTDQNLYIDAFVVRPQYFRRGFASVLLRNVLSESHCEQAIVETAAGNAPAIKLYEKFGFLKTGQWQTPEGIEKVQLGADPSNYRLSSPQI